MVSFAQPADTAAAARRRERRPCDYLYVRRIPGRPGRCEGCRFQARLWVNGHSVNLGLYRTEYQAHRAVSRVLSRLMTAGRPAGPLDVWAAMKPLVDAGELPPRLLPKYAARRPDGLFEGRVVKRGRRYRFGPFDDPAHATAAVLGILEYQN